MISVPERTASNTPFEDLIAQPESAPLLLRVLEIAKVLLLLLAVLAFVVGILTSLAGFTLTGWLQIVVALLVASVFFSLIASRWAEAIFARRAARLGLDERQARDFYRTYDWDEGD
jgi:cation transporter-like permease